MAERVHPDFDNVPLLAALVANSVCVADIQSSAIRDLIKAVQEELGERAVHDTPICAAQYQVYLLTDLAEVKFEFARYPEADYEDDDA